MIDGAIVSLSQLIPPCKRFLGPCQTPTLIRFLQFGTPKELEDTPVLALRSKRFLSKYSCFCFSLYFFSLFFTLLFLNVISYYASSICTVLSFHSCTSNIS